MTSPKLQATPLKINQFLRDQNRALRTLHDNAKSAMEQLRSSGVRPLGMTVALLQRALRRALLADFYLPTDRRYVRAKGKCLADLKTVNRLVASKIRTSVGSIIEQRRFNGQLRKIDNLLGNILAQLL